jgi:hypothetical protein
LQILAALYVALEPSGRRKAKHYTPKSFIISVVLQ